VTRSVAIFGNLGLLGREVEAKFSINGNSVKVFNRDNFSTLDSSDVIAEKLQGADLVINALAFTKVDDAERNPVEAHNINGDFVRRLCLACEKTESSLFHISTDYVFDGESSDSYSVEDIPAPNTSYGRSKLLGEQAISESDADCTIFRTSWLYGKTGPNFPITIAKKLLAGQPVRVVADQFGSPTSAKDLSDLIMRYSELDHRPRIVHATASGGCSWYEFAREIAISLNLDPDEMVTPVSSSEYETLAKRPKYSVLDNTEGPLEPIGDWRERWRAQSSEALLGLQ
jgi:dTDP-4-dehydrorhamnose reductase